MTRHSVERETESETQNCTNEESTEDHLFLPVDFPRWSNEEINRRSNEHDASEQMCP